VQRRSVKRPRHKLAGAHPGSGRRYVRPSVRPSVRPFVGLADGSRVPKLADDMEGHVPFTTQREGMCLSPLFTFSR
jgi:hypothetical protein